MDSSLRTAAQQALEALEGGADSWQRVGPAIDALKAALAEPVQEPVEPVAYIHRQGRHWEVSERPLADDEKARGWTEEPLYTSPPQRKPWVGLTEAERTDICDGYRANIHWRAFRAIEAKLQEKNT